MANQNRSKNKKKIYSKQTGKSKSRKNEKQLKLYISKTQDEINERAIIRLKSLYPDVDAVKIDDSIVPVLVVLCSDIFGGSHNTALDSAATLKVAGLALKAYQAGLIQQQQEDPHPLGIPDLNTIMPMLQNALSFLPTIAQCAGSLIECVGKNITQQNDPDLFQYGLACTTGTNLADPLQSALMQEIGIRTGNIALGREADIHYAKIKPLLKQLPNNKFSKRLIELVDKLYEDTKKAPSKKIIEGKSEEENREVAAALLGISGEDDYNDVDTEEGTETPKIPEKKERLEIDRNDESKEVGQKKDDGVDCEGMRKTEVKFASDL